MTDRPIIFSAPMVRALLDGRKFQTRRLAWRLPKPNGARSAGESIDRGGFAKPTAWQKVKPGDRLWVRESFYRPMGSGAIAYRADYPDHDGKWTPSIHMPRWASRITLTVTGVGRQRLREITKEDALAEGVYPNEQPPASFDRVYSQAMPIHLFGGLWDHLHGAGAWDANPEVVALTFTVELRNIRRTCSLSRCKNLGRPLMTARDISNPQPGFWAVRLASGAPEVGARIFIAHTRHEPGQPTNLMERSPFLAAELDDKTVDPSEVWERKGRPVSEEFYRWLVADRAWARRYRPSDPVANPRQRVDLRRVEPIGPPRGKMSMFSRHFLIKRGDRYWNGGIPSHPGSWVHYGDLEDWPVRFHGRRDAERVIAGAMDGWPDCQITEDE